MVKEILAKKGPFVASVDKSKSVLEAAREMNALRIGGIVVTEGENVVGIFTERDIMTRVVALGLDPSTTKVEQVMTAKRIRHMPVVDEGKLVGIVTSGDILAKEVADQHEAIKDLSKTIDYLHEYMYGSYR